MDAEGVPRLFVGPTPLEPAPRLARAAGLAGLWIKREDLSGLGLGGNKVRQVEAILADARAVGADTLITTAGVQSNFCRVIAAAAARTGLACRLLLRGEASAPVTGNLLLDRLFGAETAFIPKLDPWSGAVVERLEAEADAVRRAGGRPMIVHLPGRTAARAAGAWVEGARELVGQFRAAGIAPAYIVVAAGSGLTAAGLALGFKAYGAACRVHVVSVQQPSARIADWIVAVAAQTAGALGLDARLTRADFDVTEDQIAPGYGEASEASLAAVVTAARSEALVLDPVYTGKAMAGLIAGARSGALAGEAVFLHSGGTPGLFAAAATIARHIEAS